MRRSLIKRFSNDYFTDLLIKFKQNVPICCYKIIMFIKQQFYKNIIGDPTVNGGRADRGMFKSNVGR